MRNYKNRFHSMPWYGNTNHRSNWGTSPSFYWIHKLTSMKFTYINSSKSKKDITLQLFSNFEICFNDLAYSTTGIRCNIVNQSTSQFLTKRRLKLSCNHNLYRINFYHCVFFGLRISRNVNENKYRIFILLWQISRFRESLFECSIRKKKYRVSQSEDGLYWKNIQNLRIERFYQVTLLQFESIPKIQGV